MRAPAQSSRQLAPPWWLGPTALFALVVGGTMLAAASQSDNAFRLYGTPKFITFFHVLLAGLVIVAFAVGGRLAAVTGRQPDDRLSVQLPLVERSFWMATALSLFGYAIWLAVGLKNGFTLGTLREFLTTDDPLLAVQIRDDIFTSLRGITTCTQFGVAAVPLGMVLYLHGFQRVLWPLLVLLSLAGARALLFSERLALIELVVPALIVFCRLRLLGRIWPPLFRRGIQLAPVLGITALFLFFGGLEYFRSWRYYQSQFDSYAEFTVWRITGYYTTAHNNGAMALSTQQPYPLPYSTLRSLWSIPGLEDTSFGYQQLTGVDPERRHEAMLERYGTAELNNEGGLFQPALDYGLAGLFVFWCGCGFVAARLYAGYLGGTLIGLTMYPLIFLAILETPRLLYLCYTRSLPAVVALLVIAWFAARHAPRTVPRPSLALATG
jgi:hypothetical protein